MHVTFNSLPIFWLRKFPLLCSQGKVEVTIAGGRIVWENEELKVVPGSGKYISMPPFNYLYHGIDKADARYLTSLKAPVNRIRPSL